MPPWEGRAGTFCTQTVPSTVSAMPCRPPHLRISALHNPFWLLTCHPDSLVHLCLTLFNGQYSSFPWTCSSCNTYVTLSLLSDHFVWLHKSSDINYWCNGHCQLLSLPCLRPAMQTSTQQPCAYFEASVSGF